MAKNNSYVYIPGDCIKKKFDNGDHTLAKCLSFWAGFLFPTPIKLSMLTSIIGTVDKTSLAKWEETKWIRQNGMELGTALKHSSHLFKTQFSGKAGSCSLKVCGFFDPPMQGDTRHHYINSLAVSIWHHSIGGSMELENCQFLEPLLTWCYSCTRAVRVPSYQALARHGMTNFP